MGKTSSSTIAKATTPPANNVSYATLQKENETLRQQAVNFQTVAQNGATRLLHIESLVSPQLTRNPNFWNVLFHFKEVILILKEVMKIIKEFKTMYIRQENVPQPDTANGATE